MSDHLPGRSFILLTALSTLLLVSACEGEVERDSPVTSPAVGEAASVPAADVEAAVFTAAIRYIRAQWDETSDRRERERGSGVSLGEVRIVALNVMADGERQPAPREVQERVSDAVGVQFHPQRWVCVTDEEQRTSISVDVEWVSGAEAEVSVVASSSFPGGLRGTTVYPLVLYNAGEDWLVKGPPHDTFPRGPITIGGEC